MRTGFRFGVELLPKLAQIFTHICGSFTVFPLQSTPAPGAGYSLFGGGVRGKYVSLDAPKQIIQTWSLQSPNWPSGHEATLTTSLDQSSDSTTVKFTLNGVPLGKEDEIKKNLEGY